MKSSSFISVLAMIARSKRPIYVYVDGSNIFYCGRQHADAQRQEDPHNFRLHVGNLWKAVAMNRVVKQVVWCMSTPDGQPNTLANHIQDAIRSEPLITPQFGGREFQIVDYAIQSKMLRTVVKHSDSPGKIVLCTGDGAGLHGASGFLYDLKLAVSKDWDIEVVAWRTYCNKRLRAFAEREGVFLPIEDIYCQISYINGGRNALCLDLDAVRDARVGRHA